MNYLTLSRCRRLVCNSKSSVFLCKFFFCIIDTNYPLSGKRWSLVPGPGPGSWSPISIYFLKTIIIKSETFDQESATSVFHIWKMLVPVLVRVRVRVRFKDT